MLTQLIMPNYAFFPIYVPMHINEINMCIAKGIWSDIETKGIVNTCRIIWVKATT